MCLAFIYPLWPHAADLGLCLVVLIFQGEEWSRCLTRVGSLTRLNWPTDGGKARNCTYGSPLPFLSPLCVAVPSSFLNDCGLRLLPLIRQGHRKNPTRKKHNKTHCFFLSPSYQLFLNICGYDSSKSTSIQLLPRYRNPFPCGGPFLGSSCHHWTPKHLGGTPGPGSHGGLWPGLQRLQVLK